MYTCCVSTWQNFGFPEEPFPKGNSGVTLKAYIKTLTFHSVWSNTSQAGREECGPTRKVHTRPRHLIIDQSGLERRPKKRDGGKKKYIYICHFLPRDHSSQQKLPTFMVLPQRLNKLNATKDILSSLSGIMPASEEGVGRSLIDSQRFKQFRGLCQDKMTWCPRRLVQHNKEIERGRLLSQK